MILDYQSKRLQQIICKVMTQFDSKLIAQAKKTKGYLLKKSNSTFSTWKKKYFIFLDDSLCIFKDQTLQSLQKSLNFSNIAQVVPFETVHIQIKTSKKCYLLKADSPADQDLWIASINILKENYLENIKSPKKPVSRSQSIEKPLTSSYKSADHTTEISRSQSPSKRETSKEKITYLLKEKQLSKLLALLSLEKLSMVTKEQKYLSRILFIEDKKNGMYFSLSSKSIYPVIDGQLTKEDFIYPYQLNVLYFLPINTYKIALQSNNKSIKLNEVCKCNEILESTIINFSTIKLQVHCQKPIQIEVKHLSEPNVKKLSECIRKLVEVGKEYWNPSGKLLRNIDEFTQKFQQNNYNELVFYKMVENEFQKAQIMNGKLKQEKKQIQNYFNKIDSLTNNLKNFIEACQIKSPPLNQLKEKFVKLYHKFFYNYLNQNWNFVYKNASNEDLIIYSKKVYIYFQVFNPIHSDLRVKEGCKTLLKIALRNFHQSITMLNKNFTGIEEESLRILKKIDFEKDNQIVTDSIFFSTYCTNFFSVLILQFRSLSEIPKSDQFVKMSWASMHQIFKTAFEKLSEIAENCKERSSLISISNSLNLLKKNKIPQLFTQLQKTLLCTYRKEKQDFVKEINYEIGLVENFCVKKLFVITFSSIDKEILKSEIKNMDFLKICSIVIDEISRFEHILPEVRMALYEAAFEEVCYFFYICIVKFDNKALSKDECLSMINQKMTAIRDSFFTKVDEQKVMCLLKDLNLLKQFITCPTNNLKIITKELKRVFGSNFTELNLKNIISLRVSTLKQKQCIFEECREEIKSSYNSLDQIESFQRESYFNGSTRRQRVSTLTESLKSYCEQFEKVESRTKKQRTILFGVQNSIHQGYMYRKRIIKTYNTSYNKFFYRLKKGKLFQYDNQYCEDILNCYLLNQLKKCFLEPQQNQSFHLEFDKEILKFKTGRDSDASNWIQKILEAMEDQKSLLQFNDCDTNQDGVLFQDLSKKITFQTKETNEASSPKDRSKMKKCNKISDGKISLLSPKKTQNISPMTPKKGVSPPKIRTVNELSKLKTAEMQQRKKNRQKGCGTGCNFF